MEKLQRENEKLKVERKCQKTNMQSMTRYSNNFSIDKTRSSLEDSVLKENSSNTSQISDTSLFFK
jgi:cytidylate kinase